MILGMFLNLGLTHPAFHDGANYSQSHTSQPPTSPLFHGLLRAGEDEMQLLEPNNHSQITIFCTLDRSGLFIFSLGHVLPSKSPTQFAKTGPKRQNSVYCGEFLVRRALPKVVEAWKRLILTYCIEL